MQKNANQAHTDYKLILRQNLNFLERWIQRLAVMTSRTRS